MSSGIAAVHLENHSREDKIVTWQFEGGGGGMSCLAYIVLEGKAAKTYLPPPSPPLRKGEFVGLVMHTIFVLP